MLQPATCAHLTALTEVNVSDDYVCDACVEIGATWVHLRTCQQCGRTHCCDASPNRHATKHYQATQHPVVASAEPGERWVWCYVDEKFAEY